MPLSYAAIALLAALALGGVLLTTLRGYYLQLELGYLAENVQAVSSLFQVELPLAMLQSQLGIFSFFSQTCVRFLDAAGQELADSGTPEELGELSTLFLGLEGPEPSVSFVSFDVIPLEVVGFGHIAAEGVYPCQ